MATHFVSENDTTYPTNVTRKKLASLQHIPYFDETAIQPIGFRRAGLGTRLMNAFDCSAALITRFRINRIINTAVRIKEENGPALVDHYFKLDSQRRWWEKRIQARHRKLERR